MNYPLNWDIYDDLPTVDLVETESDTIFGDLNTTYTNMTYMVPDGATAVNSTILKQLNALNAIWIQINKIRIGLDSDIDVTRSFLMLEVDDGSGTTQQVLATMPGQYFNSDITSTQFTSFSWYQEAIANNSQLVTIKKQDDPFNGGLDLAVGYAKGFTSGDIQGAIGVLYSTDTIK